MDPAALYGLGGLGGAGAMFWFYVRASLKLLKDENARMAVRLEKVEKAAADGWDLTKAAQLAEATTAADLAVALRTNVAQGLELAAAMKDLTAANLRLSGNQQHA